ncbi:MAG TPA: hypothetical protein VIJ51_04630 [Solirubrobacteraceae bacterium]
MTNAFAIRPRQDEPDRRNPMSPSPAIPLAALLIVIAFDVYCLKDLANAGLLRYFPSQRGRPSSASPLPSAASRT